jgi:hypothetical protein
MGISRNRPYRAIICDYRMSLALTIAVLLTLAVGTTWSVPPAGAASLAQNEKGDASGKTEDSAQNPVLQVARKALSGEFGPLKRWQYKAYKYALAQEADVEGEAWVTVFGPWEGFLRGEACAYGYACSESTAAANAIPGHYYVLIELPSGWEVRRIEDRGAARNDTIAKRRGAEVWIDRWVASSQSSRVCRYATIRAFKTW